MPHITKKSSQQADKLELWRDYVARFIDIAEEGSVVKFTTITAGEFSTLTRECMAICRQHAPSSNTDKLRDAADYINGHSTLTYKARAADPEQAWWYVWPAVRTVQEALYAIATGGVEQEQTDEPTPMNETQRAILEAIPYDGEGERVTADAIFHSLRNTPHELSDAARVRGYLQPREVLRTEYGVRHSRTGDRGYYRVR